MATAPSAFKSISEVSPEVAAWVAEVARLTTPDQIQWFDGSAAETARLRNELVARKELAPATWPASSI
jgi:phosphoenolpyruvate carboxykinase (GTP)